MPIWLRKFTFNKMQEHYKEEKESREAAETQTKKTRTPKNPNFITKASK
tara:strand:- start:2189 stop:2335 length:147 start_codon:yes stop_codon:yes gene_type:complete